MLTGRFVLGLALLALSCVGEGARILLRQPDAPALRRLAALAAMAGATLATTVVNPIGVDIFGYVLKLLTDPPSQGLVNEWQPPTVRSLAGQAFFLATLLLIAALALGRRRLHLTDTLLLCAFLWLAWSGMRYVVWFGMLAMPMLAQCVARPAARPTPQRGDPFAGVLALTLVVGVAALQPPFKPLLDLPARTGRCSLMFPAHRCSTAPTRRSALRHTCAITLTGGCSTTWRMART